MKESFEYCPYLRAMRKESRRNAEIRDEDGWMDREILTDVPETARLKAHLKRRVERQTKNKWIQYATEYANEIVMAGPAEKDAMRSYLEMVKEAVMDMNRKDKAEKKKSADRKRYGTRMEHLL